MIDGFSISQMLFIVKYVSILIVRYCHVIVERMYCFGMADMSLLLVVICHVVTSFYENSYFGNLRFLVDFCDFPVVFFVTM